MRFGQFDPAYLIECKAKINTPRKNAKHDNKKGLNAT